MTTSHKDLDKKTPGKAEFRFKEGAQTSIYFAVTALKWNFSYRDANPGDPSILEGTFDYNQAFFKEIPVQPIDANFRVKQEKVGGVNGAYIAFYAPKSEELLGEFRAKDSHNVLGAFESRGELLQGKWDVVHSDSWKERLGKKYGGSGTDLKVSIVKSGSDVAYLQFANDNLGWEFSYGDQQGESALDGTFFYHDGYFDNEYPDKRSFDADFQVVKVEDKTGHYVLIQLYKPGKTDEFLGELLAPDSGNEAADSGLLEKRYQGEWKRVKVAWKDVLKTKYGHETVAEALFYKGSDPLKPISFRFEAYELGWELSNDPLKIGQRLPGIFFFGDNFQPGSTDASYRIQRTLSKDGFYTLIQFHKPGKTGLLGEFVGADPDNRAGKYGSFSGKWKEAGYATANATALKESHSKLITLTIVNHVAEIQYEEDGEHFNVSGKLAYKDIDNLGNFVKWYQDRAIFYEDQSAKDFTAFYYPADVADKLGSKDDLGLDVTWKKNPKKA